MTKEEKLYFDFKLFRLRWAQVFGDTEDTIAFFKHLERVGDIEHLDLDDVYRLLDQYEVLINTVREVTGK